MISCFPILLLLLLLLLAALTNFLSCKQDLEGVQAARFGILHAINWAQGLRTLHDGSSGHGSSHASIVIADCLKLYEESEPLLARLEFSSKNYSHDDAVTWLSAALASHRSCLDGLEEKGFSFETHAAQNLTQLLHDALALVKQRDNFGRAARHRIPRRPTNDQFWGLLASWSAATSKADLVVAQHGSGNHKTINEAVDALKKGVIVGQGEQ